MQFLLELTRPWLLFFLYLIFAAQGYWLLAVPTAFVTCLAAFVQMHDSIHYSLGISKRFHECLLTLSGLLLLKSGHALQVTHLRHHGRCLSNDDPEGKPATWPLTRVMIEGPFHMLILRLDALRIAPQKKLAQLLETLATVAILLIATGLFIKYRSFIGLVYWAIAAFFSATMPLWAAYIPHKLAPRHPAILAASLFARVWTPVISSFAFHHVHHAFPKVPTALLPVAAKEMDINFCDHSDHHHHHYETLI
jgi:fatty acid desaturase